MRTDSRQTALFSDSGGFYTRTEMDNIGEKSDMMSFVSQSFLLIRLLCSDFPSPLQVFRGK